MQKPHGIRGELKVRLHWSESTALQDVNRVWLALDGQPPKEYALEGARPGSQSLLVKLVGIDDANAAELLRGAAVHVERQPLEPGEYYVVDLVGATVSGPDGVIGEVVEIRPYVTVDTLVIRTPEGSLVEQPLVDDWLGEVDAAAGRVVLVSTDGLIV